MESNTTTTEVKSTVKDFLQKRIGEDVTFATNDDIFELGLVNSLFALELVVFLENTFQLTVENDDLDLMNFSSVENIEKFVLRKKN
jgi:methoxymalonate biosynthesis acyl carrier protein